MLGAGFLRDRSLDFLKCGADRGFILQVELDSAHVGLVGDGVGEKLEHNGIADFGGVFRSFGLVAGDASLNRRNPISRKQLLGLELVQQEVPAFARTANDRARAFPRGARGLGAVGEDGRLVERAQVVAVSPHRAKDFRRGVGIGKQRNAGSVEDWFRGGDALAAHKTGQHRLAGLRIGLQLFGDFGGIGHPLRRQHHQKPVAVGIFGGDIQGLGVALGIGVAQNIDGIVVTPVRWKKFVQRCHGLVGKIGQLAVAGDQRIGG